MTDVACPNGHQVNSDHLYCPQCGRRVSEREAEKPAEKSGAVVPPQSTDGHPSPKQQPVVPSAAGGPSPTADGLRAKPRLALAWGGALVAVALVVVAAIALTRASHTVEGSFTLIDSDGFDNFGGGCEGSGGYSDIGAGTDVTVRDEDGALLATTSLGMGEEDEPLCTFEFTLEDVPEAKFYAFEVADRGELSYSYEEMEDNDWTFGATLGDFDDGDF